MLNNQVYVKREYLPNERNLAGLQIFRINGIATGSIVTTMLAATSGDADSQTVRPVRFADAFPWSLYDLMGMEAPFQLEFEGPKSGKKKTLELSGVTFT